MTRERESRNYVGESLDAAQSRDARPRLDPEVLIRVAESYLEADDARRDPLVVAAYRQLEEQTDLIFTSLTQSVRIVFTRCSVPYSSDAEMIGAARGERLLEVPTSRGDADHDHPFFGREYGGVYDKFRAVHDYLGHVQLTVGFDRQGEYWAWLTQDRHYWGLARWALATELHGKNSVLCTTGETAAPKAILLERGLLRRARSGLVHRGVVSESLAKRDRVLT